MFVFVVEDEELVLVVFLEVGDVVEFVEILFERGVDFV